MCGRYTLVASPDQIRQAFPTFDLTWDPPQRFNIAPFRAARARCHPDITLGWGYVGIRLQTHAAGELHENDFILAAKIDTTSLRLERTRKA